MALEIERRFLLKNENWRDSIKEKTSIEQGYFFTAKNEWIIRLRSERGKYQLTLKKHITNFTNYEFEYEIPPNEGEIILKNIGNKIKKERFYLNVDEKEWIIDCFKEDNYPLMIAEIELKEEKETFAMPTFLSEEITGLKTFSNYYLSQKPFSKWSDKELNNFTKN